MYDKQNIAEFLVPNDMSLNKFSQLYQIRVTLLANPKSLLKPSSTLHIIQYFLPYTYVYWTTLQIQSYHVFRFHITLLKK